MNTHELIAIFPNASKSFIACNSDSERVGAGACIQEQQASVPRGAHNKTGVQDVDEQVHPKFRVSVHLRYSNRRVRDIDGALSTILDCIVAARRQLASHSIGISGSDSCGSSDGGGNDNH